MRKVGNFALIQSENKKTKTKERKEKKESKKERKENLRINFYNNGFSP